MCTHAHAQKKTPILALDQCRGCDLSQALSNSLSACVSGSPVQCREELPFGEKKPLQVICCPSTRQWKAGWEHLALAPCPEAGVKGLSAFLFLLLVLHRVQNTKWTKDYQYTPSCEGKCSSLSCLKIDFHLLLLMKLHS